MSQPIHYSIKPDGQASITLEVYKTGLMKGKKHIFQFDRYEGELVFTPEDLEAARVSFAVDSSSMILKDKWVSASDRTKVLAVAKGEMLDVARYPQVRFESTRIARIMGEYSVRGNLIIKDKPQPVYIEIRLNPNQTDHLQIEGNSQIKLSDYGLKPPSALLGAIGTKDVMSARFSLIAVPSN